MVKIYSRFEYYNANANNNNVEDCVKRALTVAYSMDYNDVSRELNQIKRSLGEQYFNSYPVINEFMSRRGDAMKDWSGYEDDDGAIRDTLEDLSQKYSNGVYLTLVGESTRPTHMAAVVDGTIYDSWDSSSWRVFKMCKVSSGKSGSFDLPIEEFANTFLSYIDECVSSMQKKCPSSMTLSHRGMRKLNQYTFKVLILCTFSENLSKYASYYPGKTYANEITIKLNPRLDYETNLKNIYKKFKQRVYDWVYNIRKDVSDAEESEKLEINPKYYDNPKDLMKLPEWARPYVTNFRDEGSTSHAFMRYSVYMDPLPGDPDDNEVWFEGDTLRELKSNMEEYKQNFIRW